MRVLHVLDISIPMLAGYTSRSRYIVNNQRHHGIQPCVLTSVRHDNPQSVSMETHDDVHYHRTLPPESWVHRLPGTNKAVVSEGLEIAHLRKRIVSVAKRENVDLIHAHSSILCGIPGYLAARQLGLPFVYEIRAFWEDAAVDAGTNQQGSAKYTAIQQAETRLAKSADAVIGICQGIRNELIDRGIPGSRIFVVPNGVETERFSPIERDPEVEAKYGLQGKKVVAYIGTFAAFEGVPYLVQALIKLIKSGRDDIRGLIVGKGTTYEDCRRLAKTAGLEDQIIHPGRVPHAEVKALYSVVDVLAYPRDRQRITELVTPLKPLEAMAMEKGVIGSDVGGLKELIQDRKTGLIHRAEDVEDLSRKIETLLDDEPLRRQLGKAGREYVKRERSWPDIIAQHLDIYSAARTRWNENARVWGGVSRVFSPRFG